MKREALGMLLAVCLAACGRYGAPVPPEALAPRSVDNLVVKTTANAVEFTWTASDQDRRGRELKFVDGYRVQRKTLAERGDETDPDVRFEDLAFIQDKHVEIRDTLRKEAREAGKVGHRIESPAEHVTFAYNDITVERGKTYLYQIVPENQGGVEGAIKQIAKVVFKGEQSDVSKLDSDELEEEDPEVKKSRKR